MSARLARLPRKRCIRCGERCADAYHWWLEETSVRFICNACRASRPQAPVLEPRRSAGTLASLLGALDDAA